MNLKNFMEGLTILGPYFDKPDGYPLGAEHDQFYVYATDRPLTEEDVQKMRDLDWFQPGMSEEHYYPDEGWSAFV